MKCLAREVRFNKAYNAYHREYGTLFVGAAYLSLALRLAEVYKSFRGPGVMEGFLADLAAELVEQIRGMTPDRMRQQTKNGPIWGDDYAREDDAVSTAVWQYRRSFRDFGFSDISLALLEPNPECLFPMEQAKKVPAERLKRHEYWLKRGRQATELFAAAGFSSLAAQEWATGRPKFSVQTLDSRVYGPFAADMRVFAFRFLLADKTSDRQREAWQRETDRRVQELCGFDAAAFIEGGETGKAKKAETEPKTAERAPVPEGMVFPEIGGRVRFSLFDGIGGRK